MTLRKDPETNFKREKERRKEIRASVRLLLPLPLLVILASVLCRARELNGYVSMSLV